MESGVHLTVLEMKQEIVGAPASGRSYPPGATLQAGGANFSVFSRSAAHIELLFFDRVDDSRPSRIIPMDPVANRTYHYWHTFVPGVQAGQIYGFRAHGPFEPPGACDSIHPGCCSTRMAVRLLSRKTTAAMQRAKEGTTRQLQ